MLTLQDAPTADSPVVHIRSELPRADKDVSVVRSLFVSDVHLGSKHSQAHELLELLERYQPRYLYVVGDFIDGWKLKTRWRWSPVYDLLIQRMLELKKHGTRLMYTPGNHDAFLRGFLQNFGVIDINDRFIHTTANGQRFLVMHGDQFDRVEQSCQWLSFVATHAYDLLLSVNWWVNALRGKRHDRYAFCGSVKRRVKRLVRHVSEFEGQLVEAARNEDCEGIICGHVHSPRIVELDGVAYCNTGDWVESCTALVELEDGTMELMRHNGQMLARLVAEPADEDTSRIEFPSAPGRRRRALIA